jgi:hypothetical protein
LAKNDAIDAEMIAWFAETFSAAPSQTHDAMHEELVALVKARKMRASSPSIRWGACVFPMTCSRR